MRTVSLLCLKAFCFYVLVHNWRSERDHNTVSLFCFVLFSIVKKGIRQYHAVLYWCLCLCSVYCCISACYVVVVVVVVYNDDGYADDNDDDQ